MKKRILSALLVVSLLVCCAGAAAAEGDEYVPAPVNPTGMLSLGGEAYLVCDDFNNNILVYDGSGYKLYAGCTLPADMYGYPSGGYLDGTLAEAYFSSPYSIIPFMDGYAISDTDNNVIRFIDVGEGVVQTLAGTGVAGYADGGGTKKMQFDSPTGLAVDEKGDLYVADTGNNVIRVITTEGVCDTYAGTGSAGVSDGAAASASFNGPTGLYWDKGVLYVADTGNQRIRKIENGMVTTVAGGAAPLYEDSSVYAGDFIDGVVDTACFSEPTGILVDGDSIYVADTGNSAVRVIKDGRVSTLLERKDELTELWPSEPSGLMTIGTALYVSDAFASAIYSVSLIETDAAEVFSDVDDSDWFAGAVQRSFTLGLFLGTDENTFSPYESMSRGMFVTALGRLHHSVRHNDIIKGGAEFTDAVAGDWYFDSVAWAADNGLVSGVGGGLFNPGQSVTRQEIAVMLYRYAVFLGITGSADAGFAAFKDADEVAPWALEAMQWACANGIINGYGGELFPTGNATRAEAATMLLNFMQLM